MPDKAMAYELHIEKQQGPMSLKDWKAALGAIGGVRLCSIEHSGTNPLSGEVVTVPCHEGDAEVYFEADRTWYAAFSGLMDGHRLRQCSLRPICGVTSQPLRHL
jgi:hypothetical protein